MKRHIGLTTARAVSIGIIAGAGLFTHPPSAQAQTPTLVDPSLGVSTVVGGLSQPIAMAFIGPNDILVTEKASGQVKRATNGAVAGVVLDLPVNSNSERGLLGIALHLRFPRTPYVYLYNTESTTGADSAAVAEVPLLGNRVDRFVWDGSKLTFDWNIIKLRSFQNDLNNVINPAAPLPLLRANHNGDLIVGSAVARPANVGHLYRFRLNQRRTAFVFDDPRLQDKVADNLALDDFTTEGEEIRFGSSFGIVTHIETGADGALYLVSPSTGTIRKISKN